MFASDSTSELGPLCAALKDGGEAMSFGRVLRAMREAKNLTQRDLVELASENGRISGLVVTALSHWEDNRRVPMPPQLLAVLRILDPHARDLLALLRVADDHRYRGLVQILGASGMPAEGQLRAWEQWAGGFPLRPPRGRTWEVEDTFVLPDETLDVAGVLAEPAETDASAVLADEGFDASVVIEPPS